MSREKLNGVEFSSESLRLFAKERFGSLKGLSDAMGISPPHLSAYLSGSRAWGAAFREKLAEIGYGASSPEQIKPCLTPQAPVPIESCPLYLDIAGAVELTRSPAKRLAQLIQVAPGTLEAWESGEASPTIAQLGALLNQVVALGLARCAEHDRRPAVQEERRAAAG